MTRITREEAISELQACVDVWDKWMLPSTSSLDRYKEAVKMSLAALRGPTREQVDALKGEWVDEYIGVSSCKCTKCGIIQEYETPFCAYCGAPMTDEAVDILLKRLEALYEIPTAT